MKLNNMKKFLQMTARFCYSTTTLGHGDPSVDLTTLLPSSFTRTKNSVWGGFVVG